MKRNYISISICIHKRTDIYTHIYIYQEGQLIIRKTKTNNNLYELQRKKKENVKLNVH